MGANFCSTTFPPYETDELKRKFLNYQESLLEESGNRSYAGHLGIKPGLTVTNKVFKNTDEAFDYIDDFDKYGPAIAVKISEQTRVSSKEKKYKSELDKLSLLTAKINDWEKELIQKAKSVKSETRGCKKCGSKISVKFIKLMYCPVCLNQEFLQTETSKKQFDRLKESLKTQRNKVFDLKKEIDNNGGLKVYWFVGGWVSS